MRNLGWIGIFLVIVGIVLIVVGIKERGLAGAASKDPEEISLKNLIARGPDGNPNIILTDYIMCDAAVYTTKDPTMTRWESVWVPAVPREPMHQGLPAAPRPPQVQALLFSINARNEADLHRIYSQPKLRALVTNRIVSLGSKESNLLNQSYPGTNFSQCLIIQEGREPAGAAKLMLMIGGGSLATLAGLVVLGIGVYQWSQERKPTPARRKRRKQEEEEEEEEEEEAPRKRKRPARAIEEEDEAPRKRKRPAREVDEEEEEPAPKKRRRPQRDDDED